MLKSETTLEGFLTIRSQGKENHFHLKDKDIPDTVFFRNSTEEPVEGEVFVPGAKVTIIIEYDENKVIRSHDHLTVPSHDRRT